MKAVSQNVKHQIKDFAQQQKKTEKLKEKEHQSLPKITLTVGL